MAQADRREFVPRRGGAPFLLSMIVPIPLLSFVGAVVTDWAYTVAENLMWANWSSWLIAVGLVSGLVAAIVMLVALAAAPPGHRRWLVLVVLVAGLVVEFVNALVHTRDGWTAVVPTGMLLSIVGTLVVAVAAWLSRAHRVEVSA